jgi:proteasome lid subunit RPN8/RPN11
MSEIIITENARKVILKDAESTYPHECCGFFYGTDDDKRTVLEAIPVENTKEENRERRFEISSKDYLKAEQYADEKGLTLLGVYHSHPDHPAIPSEHDLRQALPYFSYIIVTVKKGKTANLLSWKLNDQGRFAEEKVINQNNPFDVDVFLSSFNQ